MLSEVTASSQPGSSGTLGVPPVATRMWRAVTVCLWPSLVCTCTLWGPHKLAQPRITLTPVLCSKFR